MQSTKEALLERRDGLQQQAELALLEREVRALESAIGLDTLQTRMLEGLLKPGDQILSPQQIQREVGWGNATFGPAPSQPDDYLHGMCRPFYENEVDLQNIRGMGRYLAGSDELAINVLRNMRNYTIGKGSEIKVEAKKGSGREAAAMAVQEFVDEFMDANDWTCKRESEAFLKSVIDGEILLWLKDCGCSAPRVRIVGGEHITEPDNIRSIEDYIGKVGLDWYFGVATDEMDYEQVHGFFVDWYGQSTSWDFIAERHSVFLKRNTPRECKRGISDFYTPFTGIHRGGKLFDWLVKGATIQSSISYIKEAAQGTSSESLQNALQNRLSSTVSVVKSDGTTESVTGENVLGGKILNTSGQKFHYGPMGTPQGPTFVDVYQAAARRSGSRWQMPEYMVSGDASNANYSSSLVAESPFIQQTYAEQNEQAASTVELIWKAVAMAAEHGRFGATAEELYLVLDIKCEFPNPESRDPAKQEDVFDKQQAAGVLSAKTRAAKSNLDYEQELANGAKEKVDVPIDPLTGQPMGGGFNARPSQGGDPSGIAQQTANGSAPKVNPHSTWPDRDGDWIYPEARTQSLAVRAMDLLMENCGANADGGGGFQHGNTCAAEGGSYSGLEDITVGREEMKAYVNPSLGQLEGYFNRHKEIRGILDPKTGDWTFWPAAKATHFEMASVLGIELNEDSPQPYMRDPSRLRKNYEIMRSLSKQVKRSSTVAESLRESLRDDGAPPREFRSKDA